jgi:hypothetical protein
MVGFFTFVRGGRRSSNAEPHANSKAGRLLLTTPGHSGLSGLLGSACFALAAMFRRVMLASFLSMISGVQMVTVRNVSMVPGLFGITGFVMLGRFTMMVGGKFVMFGCALVMLRAFMFCHY